MLSSAYLGVMLLHAAAATAGLSAALPPERVGGGGVGNLGLHHRQGVGNKGARLRPPKGDSATPSPEAKAAKIG